VSRENSVIDWNIAEYEQMRVMASSTLYIMLEKKAIFRTLGLKESGIESTAPKLSIFRLYVEKANELPDIWFPITFLDIIVSCDSRGHGAGAFVVLCVHGTKYGLGRIVYLMPLLDGISL
jgi:hypothetical protein